MNEDLATLAADYWRTGIIDITPGSIRVRGCAIEQLIGAVSCGLRLNASIASAVGDPSVFVTRPIAASLVAITVAILILPPSSAGSCALR